MRALLIAGLGPSIKGADLLHGSAFAPAPSTPPPPLNLARLRVKHGDGSYPLLRPLDPGKPAVIPAPPGPRTQLFPHLTTLTVQAILRDAGVEHDSISTDAIWQQLDPPVDNAYDVVLLSTTFMWDRRSLATAVDWILERFPTAHLVLGGQYSNLKYDQILREHPHVGFVVRGDAEAALPALLAALRGDADLGAIPNLAWHDTNTGRIRATSLRYIDLEEQPSPTPPGPAAVLPYESMRGCPFSCKFCSFPAASPQWRYKSATKIRDDFRRYRHDFGTQFIKALDSTFTAPPRRLRELLPLLAGEDVRWEAYSRANAIRDAQLVDQLTAAGCAALALGFESMSDATLSYMNKKVTAAANRNAFELLSESDIEHRCSFMVGYPGETPEDFELTRRFLAEDYRGRFSLYVFSLSDETMPVWADAARFNIELDDPDEPDLGWRHAGMDHITAHRLRQDTLREVRWGNDHAVLGLWQGNYEMPLAPTKSDADNLRIEKAIERLAWASLDIPIAERRHACTQANASELQQLGIDLTSASRS